MAQMAKLGSKCRNVAALRQTTTSRYAEPHWYAVQTHVGSELQVQSRLANKGVDAFLPTRESRRQWSDRNKVVHTALIPGYVFVKLALDSRHRVFTLETSGVQSFVRFGSVFPSIPEEHIEYLRRLGESTTEASSVPQIMNQGQRVRVRSGALEGVEGVLLTDSESRILAIAIPAIEHSIRVTAKDLELDAI